MARLLDALERAQRNPEKETHLALQADRLLTTVRNGEAVSEDVALELDEMDGDYLLPEIVSPLKQWIDAHDYTAAEQALDCLTDGITHAEDAGWPGVAAVYHDHRIQLRASLQGHDAASEILDAVDHLETDHDKISSNFIQPLIETISDNVDDIPSTPINRVVTVTETLAEDARSEKQFNQERSYLHLLRDLFLADTRSTAPVETDLIESYRTEADLLDQRSALQKADILESGVAACGQWMADSTQTAWKREALQARRRGIDTEMPQFTVEDVPGVDPDALMDEMQRNVETIVDWFISVKSASGSATYALYCLLCSASTIPDANKIRLNTEEFVLHTLLHRKVISPEAHTLSIDPAEADTIPTGYGQTIASKMTALGNALYQLLQEDHLLLADIFDLIWHGDMLDASTEAFLTDALLEFDKDNHPAALYLLVPHLEASIVDSLEATGRPPYTILPDETRQQLLGGLFIEAADIFGEHYAIYLRYRYTSREGMNLRNRLAHGQLRYSNATYLNAVLTLFDILRCMVTINSATYLQQYGIPRMTLSPDSHYGDPTDLTLFTDPNRQIIGYGRSTDDHTIVVLREHRNEQRTELYVSRGRIHRYHIDEIGLNRCDLRSAVAALRDDHPRIPDDIDWTWLDTDDLLIHTLQDIIDSTLATPAATIPRDRLFTLARQRGIDESTARSILRHLEDQGEIIQTDREGRTELVRSQEAIKIKDTALAITGIGERRAWAVVDQFDSYDAFIEADPAEYASVDGIGPELAHRLDAP